MNLSHLEMLKPIFENAEIDLALDLRGWINRILGRDDKFIQDFIICVGSGVRNIEPNAKLWVETSLPNHGLGHPALIGRHAPFPVTHQVAERCLWSPEGSILGVAFSKHLVQIYAFNLNEELRQHLEIDAHIGSVNDIAFSYPKKTLSIITCGDDKAIKVSKTMWLISQKIVQEELYVLNRFRCMMNSFSSGCSLLALGSNAVHKLWQWPCDERNPSGKSTASVAPQLRQPPNGILMTNERSDNNPEEATACIALSKNDSYATFASGGKVSPLNMRTFKVEQKHALVEGLGVLHVLFEDSRIEVKISDSTDSVALDDVNDTGIVAEDDIFENAEIDLALDLRGWISRILGRDDKFIQDACGVLKVLFLIDAHIGSVNDIAFSYPKKTLSIITCGNDKAIKVWDASTGQKHFSSGCSLLALGSNAVHKLWQWSCDEQNPSGKSTASVAPQLRQPPNGILMTNERSDNNPEEAAACIALSKNDSYATSASGGKVSPLNMRTFKVEQKHALVEGLGVLHVLFDDSRIEVKDA
ncbi:hypothetical protein ZIOFF_073515 [Zingiber officinale]|uniref:Uncharacterized protein n=1 Tax=Zingiber officinale TaxID=94328 RepID=A0A8J5ETS8_ZINOF|nr:hypothetical protein ZIOFF_073515 [Zingiber officinale]